MHELKETQVERQFLLRNAAMGPQPRTQQRPAPLGGVDMDLVKAVAVVIAGSALPPASAIDGPFRSTWRHPTGFGG